MEKIMNDFSNGLFLWQAFLFVLVAVTAYFVAKLYKKAMQYMENKAKATE